MISFSIKPAEHELVVKIAERADRELFRPRGISQSVSDTIMDFSATIAQGVPLRLQELLEADGFNFAHDVAGIRRHINRETGVLENCFSPRFTDRSAAE